MRFSTLVSEIESAGHQEMPVLGEIGDERDSQAMVDAAVRKFRRLGPTTSPPPPCATWPATAPSS